jgi:inner membrane protein
MDSLTQIVLGAGVAEASLGRKAGNRAPLWGALAGTLPDLDIIPAQYMGTVEALAFHRGISHSLLFALLVAPLLGYLVHRLYRGQRGSWGAWSQLFFLCLFTHALLDCFTTWGVQLFWPLDYRLAWKTIFVVDPFYTLPFLLCLTGLLFLSRHHPRRRKLARAGLIISSAYLALTVFNKYRAHQVFAEALQVEKIKTLRLESRPTPLQNVLWAANAESPDAFYIGFYSFLDADTQIKWQRFPKNQHLPKAVADDPQVQKLKQLTQGWYNLNPLGPNRWILNDFRFGQLGGYQAPAENFVFSYLIEQQASGRVTISERETTSPEEGRALLLDLGQRILGR